MRSATILLVLSIVVFAPAPAAAQTLDQLHHPLVSKGQVAVAADYDTYTIEHFAHLAGDPVRLRELSTFEPRYAVLPTFAAGLAPNVQFTLNGTYQFPTMYSEPTFGIGNWDYSHQETLVRTLSGNLLFRPRPNLELGGAAAFGQSRRTSNYARMRDVDALNIQSSRSTVVSVQGTWLSSARAMTNTVRADLDGLLHPLLQSHRWTIDGEATARWYRNDTTDSDEIGSASDTGHGASRDFRLRLGAAHAVTDRLQLAADAYWHPPFDRTQDFQLAGTGIGLESYGWPQRFDKVLGGRLNGRWRPLRFLEAFATGAWEHQTVTYTPPTSGTLNFRSSTLTAGATWLSRPPRRSEKLTADLSGLYHPILEPKQVRIDGFAYAQAYRTDDGLFNLDTRLYRVQATTGISPWLQASGYAGALLSKNYLSHGKFDRSGSYGGEVRLRVRTGAELYGTVEKNRAGFVDEYPMFVLASADNLGPSVDFLHPRFEGTFTAHLGVRFVF
jgi:hypothetical protein